VLPAETTERLVRRAVLESDEGVPAMPLATLGRGGGP